MRGTLMFKVCKKLKETNNEFKIWNGECLGIFNPISKNAGGS